MVWDLYPCCIFAYSKGSVFFPVFYESGIEEGSVFSVFYGSGIEEATVFT
jgi:hypothetical protein